MLQHPVSIFCPYPAVSADGSLVDGMHMLQSRYCRETCKDHECSSYAVSAANKSIDYFTCPHGFSVATVRVGTAEIRINGVVETVSSTASPEFKRTHRDDRKLKAPELREWVSRAADAYELYETALRGQATAAVASLHEVKSQIGNILNTAESWIQEQVGATFDEQVDRAPAHLRTIHHACKIILLLLRYTDILANPDSITFGGKSPRSIHGMAYSFQRIFRARALKRGMDIKLSGRSFGKAMTHESFSIIPLVLIDNAIKHSISGSDIIIRCNDTLSSTIVFEIESDGHVIPEPHRALVFRMGVRSNNTTAHGSGLGLYIAQQIAQAHGIEIRYSASVPTGIGQNKFWFEVPLSNAGSPDGW